MPGSLPRTEVHFFSRGVKMHKLPKLFVAAVVVLAACSDNAVAPSSSANVPQLSFNKEKKDGADLSNYVAIGTSISMGWFNDGVFYGSQDQSWVKQLADEAGVSFTSPLIDEPGCQPPLASPLGAFSRVDGSSVALSSTTCSPLLAGVTPGRNNLSVEHATAIEALNATPATATAGRGPVTSRVLPPGMTQITEMRAKNPTFVSVEFGGNEILPAQVGVIAPGFTVVPFAEFQAAYAQIIDNVAATGAEALLVTLPKDIRKFPTIRTSQEVASQRAAFAGFNVTVDANCDTSPNFIFVRGKVLTAVATGAYYAANRYGPYNLSCADVPGTADYVLTPADITTLNGMTDQFSDEIERQAKAHGYAMFSLGELYDKSKHGVPFDLIGFMTSGQPYGPTISLDGVHPTAAGHAILADAASKAIRKTYGKTKP